MAVKPHENNVEVGVRDCSQRRAVKVSGTALSTIGQAAIQSCARLCDVSPEAVFTAAVALTLRQYSQDDEFSLSICRPNHGPDTSPINELHLRFTPRSLVRHCIETVAKLVDGANATGRPRQASRPPRPRSAGRRNGEGEAAAPDLIDPGGQAFSVAFFEKPATKARRDKCLRPVVLGGAADVAVVHRPEKDKHRIEILYAATALHRSSARQLAAHVSKQLADLNSYLSASREASGGMTPAQRRRIQRRSRGPRRRYDFDGGLKALFENQVRETPEDTALIWESPSGERHCLGYEDLNASANDLAERLADAGVHAGDPIACLMRRGPESLQGLVAVIKVGGVYVPIDDGYPDRYVSRILKDVGAHCVLTLPEDVSRISSLFPELTVIGVDIRSDFAVSPPNPAGGRGADSDCLIMYTSGSTGAPKGVVHRQRQVLNRLHWMWDAYPFEAREHACQRSPLVVMPSIWELLGGLLAGVPTVIMPTGTSRDPIACAEFIQRHRVTRMTLLPSFLSLLIDQPGAGLMLRSLTFVIVGGEMFPPSLYGRFRESLPDCTLIEDYGCTEVNTIWCSAVRPGSDDHASPPGGRPIANLGAYVLDGTGRLARPGMVGELAVAGEPLARAYLGRPEEYTERFIKNEVDKALGPLLYKTGDLAFNRPDGSIKLIGRRDFQLKIRGLRVDPTEVENVVLDHTSVSACCAVSQPCPEEGDKLVVFVILKKGATAAPDELRGFIARRLPSHMVPTGIVFRRSFPKTGSGKIDRRAMAASVEPAAPGAERAFAASGDLPTRIRSILAHLTGSAVSEIRNDMEFRLMGVDSARTVTMARQLTEDLGREVRPSAIFDNCTVTALSDALAGGRNAAGVVNRKAPAAGAAQGTDIAVIGMSGRFPGAATVREFWQNLAAGCGFVTEVPADRWSIDEYYDPDPGNQHASISKWGAFLSDIAGFDPLFFRISPADAALMDPQQRIGLEEAWRAFEDAGYAPRCLAGMAVGTFIGIRSGGYEDLCASDSMPPGRGSLLGNDPSMLAARLANRLQIGGPSLTIDTACSSSLAAVHQACRSLIAGECEMALAGGVSLTLSVDFFIATSRLGIFSPTGQCRAFDRDADGFVQGEGAGFVILKPLQAAIEDGDGIHAVIKGSALHHDGRTNGLGAPSARSQSDTQTEVYRRFGISPDSISYVEAHGTGTVLGDQIEIEALTRTFGERAGAARKCAIGSVKTNIGHLTAAAGIAGLIKVILSLKEKRIPPSLNFAEPNPAIGFENTPFHVNTRLTDWCDGDDGSPRRAAVNSFGLGGTNVHCVVEEAPEAAPSEQTADDRADHLIILSAQSEEALRRQADALHTWIKAGKGDGSLADIAFTLLAGRERHPIYRVLVTDRFEDLLDRLTDTARGNGLERCSGVPGPLSSRGGAATAFGDFLLARLRSGDLDRAERRETLRALGDIMVAGFDLEPHELYSPGAARRLSLPGYSFDRRHCWPPEPRHAESPRTTPGTPDAEHRIENPPAAGVDRLEQLLRDTLADLLSVDPDTIEPETPLETLGYDSVVAVDLQAALSEALASDIPLTALAGDPTFRQAVARIRDSVPGVQGNEDRSAGSGPRVPTQTPGAHGIGQAVGQGGGAPFPLTDLQASYYFGKAASTETGGCQAYVEFEIDRLIPDALERAWNRLVARHPMLRVRILKDGTQTVSRDAPAYKIETFRAGDDASFEERIAAVRRELLHKTYQPLEWPLFDVRVTLDANGLGVVHVSMDAWIADWRSAERLHKEWRQLYEDPAAELPPVGATFADYVAFKQAQSKTPEGAAQRAYWKQKLAACPDGPRLPHADGRGMVKFRRFVRTLDPKQWQAFKEQAAGASVFKTSAVLTCFAKTLAWASRQDRFAVVLTHAHRPAVMGGLTEVIGPFTSVSLCIVEDASSASVSDLADRLNEQLGRDLANRDVCASGILGEIAAETGRLPDLPVLFTARLNNDRVERSWFDDTRFALTQSSGVTLDGRLQEIDGALEICWDIAESKLPGETAEQMLDDFVARLSRVAASGLSVDGGDTKEIPVSVLQRAYLAARVAGAVGDWTEGTVYQEFRMPYVDPTTMAARLRKLFESEPAIGLQVNHRGLLALHARRRAPMIDVEDLTMVTAEAVEDRVRQARSDLLGMRPFREDAPAIRARMLIRGGRIGLHLATDMVAADGLSVLHIYRRLIGADDLGTADAGLGTHAYIDRLRRAGDGESDVGHGVDRKYWLEKLEPVSAGPLLPGPPGQADGGFPMGRLRTDLDILRPLSASAGRLGVTMDAVLVAALNVALCHWSRSSSFGLHAVLDGRDLRPEGTHGAIGDFSELAWIVEDRRQASFAERARAVDETIAADLAHRRFSPLEAFACLPRRGSTDEERRIAYTGCLTEAPLSWPEEVVWDDGVSMTPGIDMDCFAHNLGGRLGLHLDFRRSRISEDVAEGVFGQFVQLLEALAADRETWHEPHVPEGGCAAPRPAGARRGCYNA